MTTCYTRTLPGFAVVTLAYDPHRGPGKGGQHVNCVTLHCRIVQPDGWDSGWHPTWRSSWVASAEWWDLVETAADIPDAWAGCVGGAWPPPRYDEVYFEGVEWLNNLP